MSISTLLYKLCTIAVEYGLFNRKRMILKQHQSSCSKIRLNIVASIKIANISSMPSSPNIQDTNVTLPLMQYVCVISELKKLIV